MHQNILFIVIKTNTMGSDWSHSYSKRDIHANNEEIERDLKHKDHGKDYIKESHLISKISYFKIKMKIINEFKQVYQSLTSHRQIYPSFMMNITLTRTMTSQF